MKSQKKPSPKGQMPPKNPDPVRQRYSLALPTKKKK